MSWLWGGSGQSSEKDKLDPSLREFLDKGTTQPPSSRPSQPAPPKPRDPPKSSELTASSQQSKEPAATGPAVPRESQFSDGRYAHLWKTYQPIAELEAKGKTEQEKLQDVIDTYNSRKARVGEVAQENCALEYMEQFECFKNPSWKQMATVCQKETKKFNRCFTMQSKLLTALEYITMEERPQEQYERIQLHADKLYRRMIEQEEAIKKAKEEGKPIPEFSPVLAEPEDDPWRNIKPEARAEYEKKIAELPKDQQEIERRAVEGELRVQNSMSTALEAAFIEERVNRLKRRETGKATFGDMIKTWWGWG